MALKSKILDEMTSKYAIKDEAEVSHETEAETTETHEDSNENDSNEGQESSNSEDTEEGRRQQDGLLEPEERKKSAYVPSSVLKAEKDKRREAERKAAEYEQKMADYEARFRQLSQPQPQREPEPEQTIPDYEQDPDGYYKAKLEQFESYVERQKSVEITRKLEYSLNNSIESYKKELPDIDDAMGYVFGNQYKQYIMLGSDPEEAKARVNMAALELTALAHKRGIPPAKLFYDVAKTWGYSKPAPQQQSKPQNLNKLQENIRKNAGISGGSSIGDEDPSFNELKSVTRNMGALFKNKEQLERARSIIKKTKA